MPIFAGNILIQKRRRANSNKSEGPPRELPLQGAKIIDSGGCSSGWLARPPVAVGRGGARDAFRRRGGKCIRCTRGRWTRLQHCARANEAYMCIALAYRGAGKVRRLGAASAQGCFLPGVALAARNGPVRASRESVRIVFIPINFYCQHEWTWPS